MRNTNKSQSLYKLIKTSLPLQILLAVCCIDLAQSHECADFLKAVDPRQIENLAKVFNGLEAAVYENHSERIQTLDHLFKSEMERLSEEAGLPEPTIHSMVRKFLAANAGALADNQSEARIKAAQVKAQTVNFLRGISDICNRTPQVVAAIEAKLGNRKCHEIAYKELENITGLNLSGKDIESLKENDFFGMTYLHTLDLSNNKIKELPQRLLSEVPTLNRFSLEGNQIEIIPKSFFAHANWLRELSLNKNRLTHLGNGLFSGASKLESLDISENPITLIDVDAFSGLTNLLALTADRIEITSISRSLFSNTQKLATLILSAGKLESVHPDAFSEMRQLIYLSLRDNSIERVTAEMFRTMRTGASVNLGSNPAASTDHTRQQRLNLMRFGISLVLD